MKSYYVMLFLLLLLSIAISSTAINTSSTILENSGISAAGQRLDDPFIIFAIIAKRGCFEKNL